MSKKTRENNQPNGTPTKKAIPKSSNESTRTSKGQTSLQNSSERHISSNDRSSSNFSLSETSASSAHNANEADAFGGFTRARLDPASWLPNNFRGFSRFLVFIVIIGAGFIGHIYLSAQILDAQMKQRELEQEYMAIQRQNAHITWQIAEYTSLDQIQQRAVNIGYTGSLGRSYAYSPISEDTLAQLGQTILNEANRAVDNSQAQFQRPTARANAQQVADNQIVASQVADTQSTSGELNQSAALASSMSASRIIESGLLEAIKVIDGR